MRSTFFPLSLLLLLSHLLFLSLPVKVRAQGEEFVISDIRLEGLQRISPAAVFGLLDISVGDRVNDADLAEVIRDIFSSDSFEDVELAREEDVLVIRLQERPTITAIEIDGNKLIPTDALLENMEGAGLAVGQVYRPSVLTGMQLALEDQYVGQGLYAAEVDVEVEEQERNRVALNINITEGDASKIQHINIVGNKIFDDETLADLFELQESHFTSFFRKDDRYSREKINGDLERLASFYMDQGYINFNVTSTQVSVSPNREEVYITINVDEGELYTVNEVELAGDLVNLGEVMNLVLQVREGQVFSQQLVTTSSEFITRILNNSGYFFAEAEGIPSINEDDKTVDITFFVEPGNRTYVNRISFYGNTGTVDEVLRREMRQMEGAPASTTALEQSKVRLERLGYFSEVGYETSEVPGTSDMIDVDFSVAEQLSGSIGGSIGYAQVQGLVLSASLQQNNFLGTGTQIGIGMNTSRFSTSYNFSFFDPYHTIDGVSRGFSLSYVESDYAELNLASYSTNQIEGRITYGYQVSETQAISFNFGVEHTEIDAGISAVQEIRASPVLFDGINNYIVSPLRFTEYTDPDTGQVFPISDAVVESIDNLPNIAFNNNEGFLDSHGSEFLNFTVGVSWNSSTLNRGIFPTAGRRRNLSLQVSVPGSDLQYYRLNYLSEIYIPIFPEWIIHARMELGYGDGYGDSEELPFYMNYYAGGLGTVRGFERNTLGPRSTFPQQYLLDNTQFLKDDNGDIQLNSAGVPVVDPSSPQAYLLEQLVDETGTPVVGSDGLPVYIPRVDRRNLFSGTPSPFGGNIQTTGTLELLFPMPFLENRSNVRSSFFIDAGNVFSSYCSELQELQNNCYQFSFDEFRYSAGVSVTWRSGFGPMSFSLSKPFNQSEIDETEVFQFTIGNTF